MPSVSITIYHNPRCSKSRAALQLLRDRGVEPRVIEYLKTPPTEDELRRLLGLLGLRPRALLRPVESKAAGLDDPALDDDRLIAGMVANPVTMERPIVVAGERACVGRPPAKVLELL
jgi:arsenate reductase (glutaredoxin)